MSTIDLDYWEPLAPTQVAQLLQRCTCGWWIAGGYAIAALVGDFNRRRHEDVDVGLLARDQEALRRCLGTWDLHCANPPGSLRPWMANEVLAEPTHDVWAREQENGPWRLQLMLNTADGDEWVYRRDPRIRVPLSKLVWCDDGIPYLVPEIQLLFKSKNVRPRDELDFAHALPLLDTRQRAWLRDALALTSPGHAWLARL
ncbi:MAG: amino acid transporter [Actinomycetota bacterium]|nr:amino acid transporter [Actinomycetota bacterium]